MNRSFAAQRCACQLAAAVGDYFVHVHVELRAAASHPDVEREHVAVFASEDFVTGLDDEFVFLIVETLAVVVGAGSGFFQCGIGCNHFARDQILADAEMFERSLGLRAPEFIGRDFYYAQAVSLPARVFLCNGGVRDGCAHCGPLFVGIVLVAICLA